MLSLLLFLNYDPTKSTYEGPIIRLGVSRRDYNTLVKVLWSLEGYTTKIHIASRYGDSFSKKIKTKVPRWVNFTEFRPENEILESYQKSRFVVLPLQNTRQSGVGLSVIFEAGALESQ